jgi:hypothetical protein
MEDWKKIFSCWDTCGQGGNRVGAHLSQEMAGAPGGCTGKSRVSMLIIATQPGHAGLGAGPLSSLTPSLPIPHQQD